MPVKRNIFQNWNNQIGDNMFGFGVSQPQGIASASMNVPQNMQQYFSGTNPGAYGSGDWMDNMNQLHNWPDSGARYEYNRPYNMRDVAGQVGEYGQIPGQGNVDMYTAKKGFRFPNIGITGVLKGLAEKFKRSPEKQAEIDAFNKTGMFGNYQGKMWKDPSSDLGKISLRDPVTGAVLVQNKNVDSLFGSDTIEEMAAKKDAWIRNRIRKNKPISKVLQENAKNKGFYDPPGNVTTGDGYRDTSGWSSPGYSTRSGFTGKKDTTSGEVRGHHGGGQDLGNQGGNWGKDPGTPGAWGPGAKKDGGRIGYAFGRGPVLDENVDENIIDFMQDQGIPHGEMAEKSPFEMRIDELMDTGMSWQQAYEIASEEFGQIAEGESDQGLASIV